MNPRIEPLQNPTAEVAEILQSMMPPGVVPIKLFKTMAVNPRILTKMRDGNLLDKGTISLRDREIVIDRTCAVCHAEYEWGVHIAFFAERVGLTQAQIKDTLADTPNAALWTDNEQALLALVDDLHENQTISQTVWFSLVEHYSEVQIIELITLTGYYHTIAFLVNGLQIELEAGVPRFSEYL
jgi:alkylhydroperoxidase family enzyme